MMRPFTPSFAAAQTTIGQASDPAPFVSALEFNPPVHGTWNIVHMGMLVPEAIQIYVCAANCMRGVVLTAAEMGLENRFSLVILREEDLIEGTVEDVTVEGVTQVLRRRGTLPPAVLLFTVCLHHFLGSDLDYIYDELHRRFPTVDFLRSFMDPVCQKQGLTPEQKLRRSMFDGIPAGPCEPGTAAVLGDDFARGADDDLLRILTAHGIRPLQLHDCKTYDDYRALGRAQYIVTGYPTAVYGVGALAERLERPFLYLPAAFDYAELRENRRRAAAFFGLPYDEADADREETACEALAADVLADIGQTPVAVDAAVHPRPLGLALYLLEHGFAVRSVHLDAVSAEEKPAFDRLRELAPALIVYSIIRPEARVRPRGCDEKLIALGPKAAWAYDTPYFAEQVQGAGHYGYEGIRHMLRALREAAHTEKDTRDIVPRKGWGCESCI